MVGVVCLKARGVGEMQRHKRGYESDKYQFVTKSGSRSLTSEKFFELLNKKNSTVVRLGGMAVFVVRTEDGFGVGWSLSEWYEGKKWSEARGKK